LRVSLENTMKLKFGTVLYAISAFALLQVEPLAGQGKLTFQNCAVMPWSPSVSTPRKRGGTLPDFNMTEEGSDT